MKLPEPLFAAVRDHMRDHGWWHLARCRERWIPVPQRADWARARAAFPRLAYLDQPGAGAEFLRFHRMMMRHFHWLRLNTPGHGLEFAVWTSIPAALRGLLPADYLADAHVRIMELVIHGDEDQLGGYLERTYLDYSPGSNLHTALHGLIDAVETRDHPGDPSLIEASMADLSVAHHNVRFWELHGWIDNIYALWERAHGKVPDQSPMQPHSMAEGGADGSNSGDAGSEAGGISMPPQTPSPGLMPSPTPSPAAPGGHGNHGGSGGDAPAKPEVVTVGHHHVRPVI